MNVAAPNKADLDAAMALLGLLDCISNGYYVTRAAGTDDGEDDPVYLDDDNIDHLRNVLARLKSIGDAAPGYSGRILFGAVALMDPRNRIIDPDSDVLALHPRLTVRGAS